MELRVINILDLIEIMGEDNVKRILSVFDCKKNQEIEDFVRNNAIDFANRKISITYLFIDKDIEKVYAIYAITHKVVEIDPEFSNSFINSFIIDDSGKSHRAAIFVNIVAIKFVFSEHFVFFK